MKTATTALTRTRNDPEKFIIKAPVGAAGGVYGSFFVILFFQNKKYSAGKMLLLLSEYLVDSSLYGIVIVPGCCKPVAAVCTAAPFAGYYLPCKGFDSFSGSR